MIDLTESISLRSLYCRKLIYPRYTHSSSNQILMGSARFEAKISLLVVFQNALRGTMISHSEVLRDRSHTCYCGPTHLSIMRKAGIL